MATEEQTTGSEGTYSNPVGYHATLHFHRSSQKLTISNRVVSRLGFFLRKVGTPPGNVTFAIYATDDEEVLATKLLGTADSLSTAFAYYEVIFNSPVTINEEVRIAVVDTESDNTNYIRAAYNDGDVKASEIFSHYYSSAWTDVSANDFCYIYTYTGGTSSSPTVTTQACTETIAERSTGRGTVIDPGSDAITQHGHCWDTSTNPTTSLDTKTQLGTSPQTGQFTSNITGLIPGTTYYVRAYATNTNGTSYGANVTIGTATTIGRRHWWTELEEFHYFGQSGAERVLRGTTTTSDHDGIMDWM